MAREPQFSDSTTISESLCSDVELSQSATKNTRLLNTTNETFASGESKVSEVHSNARGIFNIVDIVACSGCLRTVPERIRKLDGVLSADVNYITNKVYVDYDPSRVDSGMIRIAIQKAGYKAIESKGTTVA